MRKNNHLFSQQNYQIIYKESLHFTQQFCINHRKSDDIQIHSDFSLVSITKSKRNQLNDYFHERKNLIEKFQLLLLKPLKTDENLSLDSFEILCRLGQGGFGSVFLAYEKNTKEYLALKAIKKSELIEINKQHLIHSERQYAFALHHPNIVNFFSSFQDSDYLYLVFEWLQGGDLFSLITSQHLTELQAQFYSAQIVLALDYLHGCKIVFRDLKPENIVFTQRGYIKIIDLGLAKLIRGYTKTFCGTPHYVAPEVILQHPYKFSPDYWTLGIIIHEMVTGDPPYDRTCTQTDIESSLSTIENEFSDIIQPTSKHYNMYIRIINGCSFLRLENLTRNCALLIRSLLEYNVDERLGCGEREMLDVIEHAWFSQIDFWKIYQQKYLAPFLPIRKSLINNANNSDNHRTILKFTGKNHYETQFAGF